MTTRIKYYDNLKFIAFIMVIVIHVGSRYLYDGNVSIESAAGTFINISYCLSRACVPIFFMVSGALIYKGKDINIKNFYKNKFFNIVIPFLVIATFTFLIDSRNDINFVSINDFVRKILEERYTFHFWYIYSLIQILLLAPFLKKIVERCSKKEFLTLIIVLFAGTCLVASIDDVFLLFHDNLDMKLFPNIFCYIGYTYLGHYLSSNEISKKNYNLLLILSLISMIYMGLCTYYISEYANFEIFYKYTTINVLFPSISMFLIFKKFFNKEFFYTKLTKFTYYSYLIHILILDFFVDNLNLYNPVVGFKSVFINIIVATICTAIFSLLFGYLYYFLNNVIKNFFHETSFNYRIKKILHSFI
jgi:surface polysaccharide O-acyltransferase-like enzyme